MDLTGTVAKICIKWWDSQSIDKMNEVGYGMRLYKRYTDDINIGMVAVEEGARYKNGTKLITNESRMEDKGKAADRRTFEFVREVGNTIHPSIQVEVDFPSRNVDLKVPILSLKVWIGDVNVDGEKKKKIIHEHYVKDVANKFVIEEKSAMSYKDKRTILTQMCLQVLLNNSEYLAEERKRELVEFFIKRMQASGYGHKFRYEVLKSAINAYQKLKKESAHRPLYRGKELNTARGRAEKRRNRHRWFKRGGYESVLFVQATPQSKLKHLVQEEIAAQNVNIKVVERAGTQMKRLLQKNNPFGKAKCIDGTCFVCDTTGSGDCRKSGVTYEIKCKGDCNEHLYEGETHANGFTRGNEHLNHYHHQYAHSTLLKHCVKVHNGELQEFEMRVVDYSQDDPLMRQIKEAMNINEVPEDRRMNDRREWNIGKLPTMEIDDGT